MRVIREDKSPTRIVLKISAEASDLEPIRRHALSHFKNIKVPGFRAGKAPAHLIEQNVNQQALIDEFMEHALNDLYRQAIRTENVRPISQPDVQLKKFVPYTQMEFETTTDILSPIKLPNYKIMKLPFKKPVVTAKDVDEIVKSLQARLAERVEVDRSAKDGDEVTLDFVGYDKVGQPIGGGSGQDYPLTIGSKTFIPGFEENLVGLKAGDKKDFDVKFPADYAAGLQGQEVLFKVEVKKVAELKELKADDDLAKKAGPFKTLKELKADIKKQTLAERENQAKIDHQNELMRKIAAKTQIEVPESLVNDETLRLEEQEKQNLAYRGQTWQEHLANEGITEEEHRKRNHPEAKERVTIGLILNEIAEKEGLTVTPEERDLRLQLLRSQYTDPQMISELDKPENQREVEARILTEKTLQKLTDYATK